MGLRFGDHISTQLSLLSWTSVFSLPFMIHKCDSSPQEKKGDLQNLKQTAVQLSFLRVTESRVRGVTFYRRSAKKRCGLRQRGSISRYGLAKCPGTRHCRQYQQVNKL